MAVGGCPAGQADPGTRAPWANGLRGVAAASVVIFHLGVVFWTSQDVASGLAGRDALYRGNEGAPAFARALDRLPVDFGALGVAIFFVLSGFVIASSLDRYSRRGFLVGRCMRIIPTYAAGYLISCAAVGLAGNSDGQLNATSVLVGAFPGLPLVLGVDALPDGVVWTLIIEMMFYGICLLGYRQLTRRPIVIVGVALACVAIQRVLDAPPIVAGSSSGGVRYLILLAVPFLPVILVGVTLRGLQQRHLSGRMGICLILVLGALHFWLLSSSGILAFSLEYRLTFVGAVVMVLAVSRGPSRWSTLTAIERAADVSYPLYVVHAVLGYATLSLLAARGVRPELAVVLTLLEVLLIARVLHTCVERPSHRLGRRWATMWGRGAPQVTRPVTATR